MKCPTCDAPAPKEQIFLGRFRPYWDQSLGRQINSPGEKARILKERGLVEVGNELDRVNLNRSTDSKPILNEKEFMDVWKSMESGSNENGDA